MLAQIILPPVTTYTRHATSHPESEPLMEYKVQFSKEVMNWHRFSTHSIFRWTYHSVLTSHPKESDLALLKYKHASNCGCNQKQRVPLTICHRVSLGGYPKEVIFPFRPICPPPYPTLVTSVLGKLEIWVYRILIWPWFVSVLVSTNISHNFDTMLTSPLNLSTCHSVPMWHKQITKLALLSTIIHVTRRAFFEGK